MPLYIGLMSGTSADAIDAALVELNHNQCTVVCALQAPFPETTRQAILGLIESGMDEIDRVGVLDRQLGLLFGNTALQLLERAGFPLDAVVAIGSHGQTIRHRPRMGEESSFTFQIGDPNSIAEITGLTTVADFRRRDMAAGGQGAPLVPAFHRAVFSSTSHFRVVLNIGGIANITVLPPTGEVCGYDTGPGNGLMDAWIFHRRGEPIDKDGAWAASGKVAEALLAQLYSHSYFRQPSPKSTGREEFSLTWLLEVLEHYPNLTDADVQATLLELTALSITEHIKTHCDCAEILLCGGGARNKALVQRICAMLPGYSVQMTDAMGIPADYVEAAAFAWLAMRTLQNLPGNLTQVTGARREVVLGGIYPGTNRPG